MSDQPKALRMADELDRLGSQYDSEIAAELRRLVAENEALKAELAEQARVNGMGGEREARLMALNAELVEALNKIAAWNDGNVGSHMDEPYAAEIARAALAKVGASNGS